MLLQSKRFCTEQRFQQPGGLETASHSGNILPESSFSSLPNNVLEPVCVRGSAFPGLSQVDPFQNEELLTAYHPLDFGPESTGKFIPASQHECECDNLAELTHYLPILDQTESEMNDLQFSYLSDTWNSQLLLDPVSQQGVWTSAETVWPPVSNRYSEGISDSTTPGDDESARRNCRLSTDSWAQSLEADDMPQSLKALEIADGMPQSQSPSVAALESVRPDVQNDGGHLDQTTNTVRDSNISDTEYVQQDPIMQYDTCFGAVS